MIFHNTYQILIILTASSLYTHTVEINTIRNNFSNTILLKTGASLKREVSGVAKKPEQSKKQPIPQKPKEQKKK